MEVPKFLNNITVHTEYAQRDPDAPCGAFLVIWEFSVHFGYWTCAKLLEWRKETIEIGRRHKEEYGAFFEHRLTTMCLILKDTKLFGFNKSSKASKYFHLKLPELLQDYMKIGNCFDQEVLRHVNAEDRVQELILQFVRYAYIGFYVLNFIDPTNFNGFHVQTRLPLQPSPFNACLPTELKRWTVTINETECDFCSKQSKLLKCMRCRLGKYCSKECQTKHWSCHKIKCKEWRQAVMDISGSYEL